MSQCKNCGEEISWIRSKKSGKHLPIVPGFVTVVLNSGDCVVGRLMHKCLIKTEGENNDGNQTSED